jgi:hypothetical protein
MKSHGELVIFETDQGYTLSFKNRIYFIGIDEPFYNIAQKAMAIDDYVPFYIEIAKREGIGNEFRDNLYKELKGIQNKLFEDDDE